MGIPPMWEGYNTCPITHPTATVQTTLDKALPRLAERARQLDRALSGPQSRSATAAAVDGTQPVAEPAGARAPSADGTTPAQPAPAPTPAALSSPPSERGSPTDVPEEPTRTAPSSPPETTGTRVRLVVTRNDTATGQLQLLTHHEGTVDKAGWPLLEIDAVLMTATAQQLDPEHPLRGCMSFDDATVGQQCRIVLRYLAAALGEGREWAEDEIRRTVSHHTAVESRLSSYVEGGRRHFAYVARPGALNSQTKLDRVSTIFFCLRRTSPSCSERDFFFKCVTAIF